MGLFPGGFSLFWPFWWSLEETSLKWFGLAERPSTHVAARMAVAQSLLVLGDLGKEGSPPSCALSPTKMEQRPHPLIPGFPKPMQTLKVSQIGTAMPFMRTEPFYPRDYPVPQPSREPSVAWTLALLI